MALFLFKSVFTFYGCLNLAFKWCPKNHNVSLFSVMYSTSQSSVNDIFWCLRFPSGEKSNYSITERKKERKKRKKEIKRPKIHLIDCEKI